MRNLIIPIAAMALLCPCICSTHARQEEKTIPTGREDGEAFEGEPARVPLSAIPAKMRFQLVQPTPKFALRQLSYEWWEFPKTTRRPPFAVVGISYKDAKSPAARILVVEWKHVEGLSAWTASIAASIAIRPRDRHDADNVLSVIGTKHGTDVALCSLSLRMSRLREITEWLRPTQ